MLPLASFLAIGTFSGIYFQIVESTILSYALYSFTILLLMIFLMRRDVAVLALLCAATFLVGNVISANAKRDVLGIVLPDSQRNIYRCSGEVLGYPRLKEKRTSVDVDLIECRDGADEKSVTGRVRLTFGGRDGELGSGDIISFTAVMTDPKPFESLGNFDYPRYLLAKEISKTGFLYGKYQLLEKADAFFSRALSKIRSKISEGIDSSLNGGARALAFALAIGDKGLLDGETRDEFSTTGISHVLAISGLHVGLFAFFAYLIIRALVGFFPRILIRYPAVRITAFLSLPVVWFYVALVGYPVSAIRAGIMLSVYFAGVILGRKQDLLVTLAVSVVAILFIYPLSMIDVSFQLSATAVLGIVLISPRLMNVLQKISCGGRVTIWLFRLISVGVAAGLSAMPIVAYHFGIVTLLGFMANLIVVPFVAFILLPLHLLSATLSVVYTPASLPLWKLTGVFSDALLRSVGFISRHGSPLYAHYVATVKEVFAFYAVTIVVLYWRKMRFLTRVFP